MAALLPESRGEQPRGIGAKESDASTDTARGDSDDKPKPSKLKLLWIKSGLDIMTLSLMFKGSLAPTIGIAMFQSTAVANHYTTIGYLVAISSILGFSIMPRGKFIQTMTINVLAVCFGGAVNLLALYCQAQARVHTTPVGGSPSAYNASANAVSALWLIVQVYLVSCLRAARPQFQFPAIIYSIFSVVSLTNAPSFPNMASCVSFMLKLIEAFLTGFALATGVHFCIFPTSSRTVVFKEMTGYMMCLGGTLKAQTAYMHSMEDLKPVASDDGENTGSDFKGKEEAVTAPSIWPALKGATDALVALHPKLEGDITPAKREFAIGKLESRDITVMWKLLRMVFVPVLGLSSILNILHRRAELAQEEEEPKHAGEEADTGRSRQTESIRLNMKQLHGPFQTMTTEIDAAFQHVLITTEMIKPPKAKTNDEENKGEKVLPGDVGFAEAYRKKIDDFYSSKEITLQAWCRHQGIELPSDFFVEPEKPGAIEQHIREQKQRQLFFFLYMEHLLWRTSVAVLEVVLWADKLKQEGRFKRSKLIFPGSKTLYKWLKATLSANGNHSQDDHFLSDTESGGSQATFLGEAFEFRRDPEHLPPRNGFERFGERLRTIPKMLRSDSSAFGLRVAAATMSVGIVCYLRDTRTFFIAQRLLWSQIMIAISMTRTAGQSIFNFVLRVGGTAIAMVAAYAIWYIVDGHAAGVIVFLWLWIFCGFYVVIKIPKFVVVGILSVVTAILIVGYELQVQKLGVQASEASGQPAYPAYLLAPYRLACVAGGLLVAFIWTIFPYPVSESTELRKDLAAALYMLASFHAIVAQTVKSRVEGSGGDPTVKGTYAYHLEKARNTVFSKGILLLTGLRTNSAFSKFQVRVGGRFPHSEYESLIDCVQRVLHSTAIISYASTTFSEQAHLPAEERTRWSHDFRRVATSISSTSHQITSLLSLLSSALSNGQPLPPYLEMPKSFEFIRKLEAVDHDILSIRHIAEPEYSAFAVIQVCSSRLIDDIEELTRHVKTLVGEMDFSFHPIRESGPETGSSPNSEKQKGKLA